MKVTTLLPALAAGLLAVSAQQVRADDVILAGKYIELGLNNSGSVIDSNFTVGIKIDPSGTGNFSNPADFIEPGTPYEFYSLSYNGQPGTYGVGSYNDSGGGFSYTSNTSGTPVSGSNTTDTSSGGVTSTGPSSGLFGSTQTDTSTQTSGLLSATTSATYGKVGITQNVSFDANSGFIDFAVTLTNTSTDALTNLIYARGLDPDQDVYVGGPYSTVNNIVSPDLVTGYGATSDYTIGIFNESSWAHHDSIVPDWPEANPGYLLTDPTDTSDYGDYSINMAWDIGDLAGGQSATIDFQYRVATTHSVVDNVPDTGATVALLGISLAALVMVRRRLGAGAA